jgi:hypothetical protein
VGCSWLLDPPGSCISPSGGHVAYGTPASNTGYSACKAPLPRGNRCLVRRPDADLECGQRRFPGRCPRALAAPGAASRPHSRGGSRCRSGRSPSWIPSGRVSSRMDSRHHTPRGVSGQCARRRTRSLDPSANEGKRRRRAMHSGPPQAAQAQGRVRFVTSDGPRGFSS